MASLKRYELEEAPRPLHLKDGNDELMYADGENGEPDLAKPMRVLLYGPGSKQYARAQNAKQNHHLDLMKSKGKTKESAAEAAQSNAEFLADCTHSWENVDSENGHDGRDLSMEIYLNQRLSFIRDQVAVFLNETANFTPGSKKP